VTTCRIGFVGAGGVAARHAKMLSGFDDVRLVAVTDPDRQHAESFAAHYQVRAVPDLDALLAERLDAVYVCVPPFAHGPAERAVVSAGLAMFVEKPLSVDENVAGSIADAVAAKGLVTSVGHHWRYSAAVERAERLLDERPVRLVTGAWLDKVPPVGWWPARDHSGGQIIEQAVHVLDVARLLAGEVSQVCAIADGVPPAVEGSPEADVDGATVAVLHFRDGAVGSLAATCLLGWKHRAGIEVYADGLALTLTEESLRVTDEHGDQPTQAVLPDQAKRAADRAFVDAVLGLGCDIRVPYGEALATHRLACTIARSAAYGRALTVEEQTHATH
jgi:myo-inositol 2-dehydrogenase / D-chiro-inositol 1-dehydrogenase